MLTTSTHAGLAQSTEAEVRKASDMLFEGMRRGDSTMVRSAFLKDAVVGRPVESEDRVEFNLRHIDRFVGAVGRARDEVWDERIWDVHIRTDGSLSSAWMQYAFYLGRSLHHCGVNSMQLVRRFDLEDRRAFG